MGQEASAFFRGRRAVGLGDEELPPILIFNFFYVEKKFFF